MRLYEFEAKRLFRRSGIPVLDGVVAGGIDDEGLNKITYPVVVKAQTFLGGRGKAGLIKTASTRKEVEEGIRSLIGRFHGPYRIDKVLLEKKIDIEKELYISIIIDRLEHKFCVITCAEGGVEIEEVAAQNPELIHKYYFSPSDDFSQYHSRFIAGELGLSGAMLRSGALVVYNLFNLFTGFDCKLAEINPLVITKDKKIYALDAKIDLDEDAMFRHPELKELGIESRHEVGELTEREKFAKSAGIPYVDLDGDIGVFPGGAGFGIAAIDLIKHYGGQAANFMDSGGAPTQDKLRKMLGLLIDNPRVKAIFGARFGGISRCDDWAKALVQYVIENKPAKPMVMRMAGNMEEEGRRILQEAKEKYPELFKNIKVYSVATPIEEVIKETIRVAKTGKI